MIEVMDMSPEQFAQAKLETDTFLQRVFLIKIIPEETE